MQDVFDHDFAGTSKIVITVDQAVPITNSLHGEVVLGNSKINSHFQTM